MIIAFSGPMGSGKTAAVTHLMNKSAACRLIKFAQPLYDMQEYIYTRIHKDLPASKDRKLLQFLGGSWGRGLDPSLWVDLWELEYRHGRLFSKVDLSIFTDDLRYNNEAAMLSKYKAKIIKIESDRGSREKRIDLAGEGDISEAGIDSRFVTATVYNNGSLADFHKNLDYLYETLNSNNQR